MISPSAGSTTIATWSTFSAFRLANWDSQFGLNAAVITPVGAPCGSGRIGIAAMISGLPLRRLTTTSDDGPSSGAAAMARWK